ncbi:hypothetical protein Q4I32_001897 [Leishmania shawi]|uniref:Uncharacterized protein n=1 Tax=Leishmania shawi TaxID=5680 RepID=A0AAW3C4H2_9TRYP
MLALPAHRVRFSFQLVAGHCESEHSDEANTLAKSAMSVAPAPAAWTDGLGHGSPAPGRHPLLPARGRGDATAPAPEQDPEGGQLWSKSCSPPAPVWHRPPNAYAGKGAGGPPDTFPDPTAGGFVLGNPG